MKVYLVIHALSVWNEEGKCQGHCDPDLSSCGRAMAEQLASNGCIQDTRTILTSDLRRAISTAAPVAAKLGITPTQLELIREGNWREYHRDDTLVPKPCSYGYETSDDVKRRSQRFLDMLATQRYTSPILVVTHGGVAKSILCGILGVLPTSYKSIRTAINTIEFDNEWRITGLNDATHLTVHKEADYTRDKG